MKKALLVTDGSVDLALVLNRWLETQSERIDLTVVYAYELCSTVDQPLKAAAYHDARQAAGEALNHWLTFVSPTGSVQLYTKMLLGEPQLVLTIHLLLGQYDYLLTDIDQPGVMDAFTACQFQISTQLRWLGTSDGIRAITPSPSFAPVSNCLAA
ncbi:hypothetical protein [Spirosoma koreense]